jgi:ABC-type tungstate transport system substrate-binding protein
MLILLLFEARRIIEDAVMAEYRKVIGEVGISNG